MNWVERVFDFNPDGGDGSFELLVALGVAVAVIAVVWRVRTRRRHLAAASAAARGPRSPEGLPLAPGSEATSATRGS